MKILRISLRNLASLAGTHTVDFTREPLRTAGLFSISGPTGSGKSTLLDALCLALFEKTPRLNLAHKTVKLADGADSISQKDPANLLRRGTAEGFAEVVFVGVDREIYTARWSVRRARNRPDGALRPTEMTLWRGNVAGEGPVEQGGRKTEVLPVIAEKIGLSYEQFTRAVLLAQNDFATFLKSDDKERAEILQALTGTRRFEEISIAVFARCAAEREAVGEIEAQIGGHRGLAPEERAVAEAVCMQAENALRAVTEKMSERAVQVEWFERLAKLATATAEAEQALQAAVNAREAGEPRRLEVEHTMEAGSSARALRDAEAHAERELAAAEKARTAAEVDAKKTQGELDAAKARLDAAARDFTAGRAALEKARLQLLQARELDAKLTPLAERLTSATRECQEAGAAVKSVAAREADLSKKRDSAREEQAALTKQRTALAEVAPFARDAAAWLDRLDRVVEARAAAAGARGDLAGRFRLERGRSREAAAVRATGMEVREAAVAAEAALRKADSACGEHDAEAMAKSRREGEAARDALRELKQHLAGRRQFEAQVADLRAGIAKLASAGDADRSELAEMHEKLIPAAVSALAAARHAHALAEAAVTDAAVRLREKLQAGEPCPVCGGHDHPYAAHPPAAEAAALRALRDDREAKEQAASNLREEAARRDAGLQAGAKQESEKRRELAAVESRLEEARRFRPEHPATQAILARAEAEHATAAEARLAAEEAALVKLHAAESALRESGKRRDTCRTAHERAAQAVATLERKLAEFAADLARLQAARESAGTARLHAEAAHRDRLANVRPLLEAARGADPKAFRERFARDSAALILEEKRAGELDSLLRETQGALSLVGQEKERANSIHGIRQAEEKAAREAHDKVRAERAGLFAGRAADAVEKELHEKLRAAEEARSAREKELATADKTLATHTEALRSATAAASSASRISRQAGEALTRWLADFTTRAGRPLDRAALDLLLARDDAWMRAERAALEAADGAVRTAEGALAAHGKARDQHAGERLTPDDEPTVRDDLAALRMASDAAAGQRDAARAVIVSDDQRRGAVAELSQKLEAQKRAADPWERLNDLIGSADGAKFRGIAQRRTLDLLLGHANAQLELLSARYALERLPESLNLIVLDRDMGDERRSVHSLSGGESFLVSLALALALASLTSNRLRIESLFIDEGFGSLDPETLQTAMNALMHLEAQGRKVGVISHVSEMADAIPVQIRVVKGRAGASRLVVPGAAPVAEEPVPAASLVSLSRGARRNFTTGDRQDLPRGQAGH